MNIFDWTEKGIFSFEASHSAKKIQTPTDIYFEMEYFWQN